MTNQTGFASAVIVAGGTGSRMGRPKQMLPLGAEPVLFHTVRAFLSTPQIAQVVVVTTSENQAALQKNFERQKPCAAFNRDFRPDRRRCPQTILRIDGRCREKCG